MNQSQSSDRDASKRRPFPPPPPRQHPPSLSRGFSAGSSSSFHTRPNLTSSYSDYSRSKSSNSNTANENLKFNPSNIQSTPSSFANPPSHGTSQAAETEETTQHYSQYAAAASASRADNQSMASVADTARITGSFQQSSQPSAVSCQTTNEYNRYNTQQQQQQQQQLSDASSYYYSNTGKETLKSRNNISAATTSTSTSLNYPSPDASPSSSYMLGTKPHNPTANNNNNHTSDRPRDNNGGRIALLLFPPLSLLLIYEMPSSLPSLLFVSLALIAYAVDLGCIGESNTVGGRSRGGYGCSSYYTLTAVWGGWFVLSAVVSYVLVTASSDGNYSTNYAYVAEEEDSSKGGSGGELRSFRFIEIIMVMGHLLVSILLLFCLVSTYPHETCVVSETHSAGTTT